MKIAHNAFYRLLLLLLFFFAHRGTSNPGQIHICIYHNHTYCINQVNKLNEFIQA